MLINPNQINDQNHRFYSSKPLVSPQHFFFMLKKMDPIHNETHVTNLVLFLFQNKLVKSKI